MKQVMFTLALAIVMFAFAQISQDKQSPSNSYIHIEPASGNNNAH